MSKLFIYFHPSDHELSDNEISNHRHVYVGFHLPSSKKRNTKTGHNGGGGHKGHAKNKHLKVTKEELRPGESHVIHAGDGGDRGEFPHSLQSIFSVLEDSILESAGKYEIQNINIYVCRVHLRHDPRD